MRERAVRTRRKPLGARNTAFKVFHESRDTRHETRLFWFSRITAFFRPSPKPPESHGRPDPRGFGSRNTRHESRITAFPVARMVHVGTEALQSCFFRPGMLGNSTGRRSPCGSRIRASQAFTSRKPLILRFLRNTNHETRVTAVMFLTNHESRNTTHGFVFFTNHGTRNMVSMVHVGTEALQSFFSR